MSNEAGSLERVINKIEDLVEASDPTLTASNVSQSWIGSADPQGTQVTLPWVTVMSGPVIHAPPGYDRRFGATKQGYLSLVPIRLHVFVSRCTSGDDDQLYARQMVDTIVKYLHQNTQSDADGIDEMGNFQSRQSNIEGQPFNLARWIITFDTYCYRSWTG